MILGHSVPVELFCGMELTKAPCWGAAELERRHVSGTIVNSFFFFSFFTIVNSDHRKSPKSLTSMVMTHLEHKFRGLKQHTYYFM